MGYTTDFWGSVKIVPALNQAEINYLTRFSKARHMQRTKGPFYTHGSNSFGPIDDDVLEYNYPDPSQPGLWCQWVPSDDGSAIWWDENEKFYSSEEWMCYLIDTFLKPGCSLGRLLTDELRSLEPELSEFTCDHICNGIIDAQGEDPGDRWRLVVKDNVVTRENARLTWD